MAVTVVDLGKETMKEKLDEAKLAHVDFFQMPSKGYIVNTYIKYLDRCNFCSITSFLAIN
jgi:hypothetical protein